MALHGHTAIELYDAKTGKLTDRVEKDNLVTGAVEEYLSAVLYRSIFLVGEQSKSIFQDMEENYNNSGRDFIKEYFGGVLVFDKAINESEKVVTNDDVCHNIGFAGLRPANQYRVNSGSFNAVESVFDREHKMYKFVWDFSTSACNGDIASICLTNERVGWQGIVDKQPFPSEDNGQYINFIKSINLPTIITNDRLAIYKNNSNGKYTLDYSKISKFNEGIGTFGIGDSYYNSSIKYIVDGSMNLDFDSVKPSIPSGSSSGFTTLLSMENAKLATELSTVGVWYFSNSSNYTGGFRFVDFNLGYRDYSYNFSSLVDNIYTFMENEVTKYNIVSDLFRYSATTFREEEQLFIFSATHNGKVRVYKATSSDFTYTDADIKTTVYKNNTINFCIEFLGIKMILLGWRHSETFPTFLVLDNNYNPTDKYYINTYYFKWKGYNNSNYVCPKKNITEFIRLTEDIFSQYSSVLIDPFYLATINNQSDVLTKTPDKTMKIIYTLTEE